MKKLGKRAILSALALLALSFISVYGSPSDSTKSPSTGMMPSHNSLFPASPSDTLPDSLKLPEEPFDSTLLTATFVIETRHKLYPKFLQIDTVTFGQTFPIGEDNEYMAKVIKFNPHLAITSKGQQLRLSDTLYNPAVRLQVMKGDSLAQETWGFYYTDAPHFRANAYLGFKLVAFKVNEQHYIKPPDKK